MNTIKDSNGNIVVSHYISAISRKNAIKIEHRLLDGSYHYQTIGAPGTIVDLQFVVNEDGKEVIDMHEATCAPIQVETADNIYIGIIREVPKWELMIRGNKEKRIYRCTCSITLTVEGAV